MIRILLAMMTIFLLCSFFPVTVMAGTPPCELQRIDASAKMHFDAKFGNSVAMSDDGDYLVVGAGPEDINGYDSVGAVYVFIKDGSSWTDQARLTAPSGEAWDQFGTSVDITSDGYYIVVGANQKGKTTNGEGEAHVFSRSGTTWSWQAELNGDGAVTGSLFGCSVAIDTDGDTVLVGAKYDGTTDDEDYPLWKRGEVYVFTRSGTNWSEKANLYADDWNAANDGIIFGASVDICGNIAVIGAREADCRNDDEGAVYIFTRDGTTWDQETKLIASDGASQDWFGFDVAVDGDADTIVVGARHDNDEGSNSGSAYIFTKNIQGLWTEQDKVTASDGAVNDHFGRSVAISSDGASILVGANLTDIIMEGFEFGTAYYFTPTLGEWSEDFIIEADDKASDDWFGWDVCMSGDGKYGVIGALRDDIGLVANAGSAYVVGLKSTVCP